MKTDAATKILLALIASALWIMILGSWLGPRPVAAQAPTPVTCSGDLRGNGAPPQNFQLQFACK
jgi:hypothetical protein